MPAFETAYGHEINLLQDPLNFTFDSNSVVTDASSDRVNRHMSHVDMISMLHQASKHLTGCNKKEKKFKHWVSVPSEFNSSTRKKLF